MIVYRWPGPAVSALSDQTGKPPPALAPHGTGNLKQRLEYLVSHPNRGPSKQSEDIGHHTPMAYLRQWRISRNTTTNARDSANEAPLRRGAHGQGTQAHWLRLIRVFRVPGNIEKLPGRGQAPSGLAGPFASTAKRYRRPAPRRRRFRRTSRPRPCRSSRASPGTLSASATRAATISEVSDEYWSPLSSGSE